MVFNIQIVWCSIYIEYIDVVPPVPFQAPTPFQAPPAAIATPAIATPAITTMAPVGGTNPSKKQRTDSSVAGAATRATVPSSVASEAPVGGDVRARVAAEKCESRDHHNNYDPHENHRRHTEGVASKPHVLIIFIRNCLLTGCTWGVAKKPTRWLRWGRGK